MMMFRVRVHTEMAAALYLKIRLNNERHNENET